MILHLYAEPHATEPGSDAPVVANLANGPVVKLFRKNIIHHDFMSAVGTLTGLRLSLQLHGLARKWRAAAAVKQRPRTSIESPRSIEWNFSA